MVTIQPQSLEGTKKHKGTEINQIIKVIDNSKYRLMISLGYACGMRVSEVVKLKIADLDIDELVVLLKELKR